ncbi:hypothetical protein NIES2101_12655 [Calothrix sp. HK-06]|nr:hypothetical protein NIES2101_12655 [Calothrix sp. HK-06]
MDRFPLRTTCKMGAGEHTFIGYTNNISESGASITLANDEYVPFDTQSAKIEFTEQNLCIEGKILRINSTKKRNKKQYNIIIEFTNVSLEQNRALVEMLYCDMTWWKKAKRPSGVDVFIEMMSSLFGLRSLMTKY